MIRAAGIRVRALGLVLRRAHDERATWDRDHVRAVGAIAERVGVAGDLAQDVFLELHRARRTYAPPLPVRPWVFGIARNVAARRRRAARVRPQTHRPLDAERDAMAASAPSAAALDIETALAALPASARDAWVLHHVQGFSFHSIAARLGVTVMAAKLRSSRAMRALRAAPGGAPESPDHD